jgi:hypothetical protein
MVVMDHLIISILDVHAHQVLEDSHVKSLPMLVENMSC